LLSARRGARSPWVVKCRTMRITKIKHFKENCRQQISPQFERSDFNKNKEYNIP
jgi:hypothetical protein